MVSMIQRLKTTIALFVNVILFVLPLVYIGQVQATECNLSRQEFLAGGCPAGSIGEGSANPKWTEATVDPKTDGRSAVDAFGYCRYIGNTGDKPLFVPFGNGEEWHAFLTNHPNTAYLLQCSRGGNVVVPPNFGTEGVTNQCVTTTETKAIYAPYKPVNVPGNYMAPSVTYNCKSADGTEFSESVVAYLDSHDSGYGPSDDIGWKITKALYTYNGVCGAAKGIETETAPTNNLCSVGVPGSVIGTGPFMWICASGNGGGKNITCATGTPCEIHKVDEQSCRCENEDCYNPIYWADSCGHSWLDKSKKCDNPEPKFKPLPPIDYDNDHLRR